MDTWGTLPKSQIDPETILEAVAALIANHNDDPDSHLLEGQSLQSHKAAEIIDHLAESIVTDKLEDACVTGEKITSNQIVGKDIRTAEDVGSGVDGVKLTSSGIEMWDDGDQKINIPTSGNPVIKGEISVNSLAYLKFTLRSLFESLDGFECSSAFYFRMGYVDIVPADSIGATEYLNGFFDDFGGKWPDVEKNPIFEATLLWDGDFDKDIHFGFSEIDVESGAGFHVTDQTLRAIWYDADNDYHYATIGDLGKLEYHVYRVEVVYGVSVNWYLDGALVITKTWAQIGSLAPFGRVFRFVIENQSTSGCRLILSNVLYQQNL